MLRSQIVGRRIKSRVWELDDEKNTKTEDDKSKGVYSEGKSRGVKWSSK